MCGGLGVRRKGRVDGTKIIVFISVAGVRTVYGGYEGCHELLLCVGLLGVWDQSRKGRKSGGEIPGLKRGPEEKEGSISEGVDPARWELGAVELLAELTQTRGDEEIPLNLPLMAYRPGKVWPRDWERRGQA